MSAGKLVHCGGGNIGRGFVGEFFHQAGYEVVFLDVVGPLVENLQKTKSYTVTEVSEDGKTEHTVTNYRAVNSKDNEAEAIKEMSTADVITCSVGPNILKFIAPNIAKAIAARKESKPAVVIACENAVYATKTLQEFIFKSLDDESKANIDKLAKFASSAVDRIVGTQPADAGLNVVIEKFHEFCVELPPIKGIEPKVSAIHYVDNLEPYIERKLFTVNTGHATTAYLGTLAGKQYIHESLADDTIKNKVKSVLKETASLIIKKHGIAEAEQEKYVDSIILRFLNPSLQDSVNRVGRQPLRKLSKGERLISPASQLAELGLPYNNLLDVIEAALKFQNVEGDDESVKLAEILKSKDAEAATQEITGLSPSDKIYAEVVKLVKKVQG